MAKVAILFSALILSSASLFAQEVNEVTLTVSGEGATKTDATAMALRSAIEQAFGTFVSANTAILNDELIKDEIATVSSGNVKRYEEIASAALPNGDIAVTLKATVSIQKLISYAKSKGSSAEFAGQTFAMNLKLKELNKANEEKAIEDMLIQLYKLLPTLFNYDINVGEPQVGKVVVGYDNNQQPVYSEEGWILKTNVSVKRNTSTHMFYNILTNTLKSLALNSDEIAEYEKTGLKTHRLGIYPISPQALSQITSAKQQSFEKYKQEYRFRSEVWQDILADFFNIYVALATLNFRISLTNNPDNISEIVLVNPDDMPRFAGKLLDVNGLLVIANGYIAQPLRNDGGINVPSYNSINKWIVFPNFHYCSALPETAQVTNATDSNNRKKKEKKDKPSFLSRMAESVVVNGVPLSSRQTPTTQTARAAQASSSLPTDLSNEAYDVLFTESFRLFIPKDEISSIQGFEIMHKPWGE